MSVTEADMAGLRGGLRGKVVIAGDAQYEAARQWKDTQESPSHIGWVRSLWSRLEPHLQGTAYVNHLAADDRPEKVRASFGENYSRLRALKAVYDPNNLFRLNANIAPG